MALLAAQAIDALVESRDGIEWSAPQIVLGPNEETDWEDNINRPGVLRRDGVYHMWYTGQPAAESWIGYATSPDGILRLSVVHPSRCCPPKLLGRRWP